MRDVDRSRSRSLVAAVGAGAIAGSIGTVAMDALRWRRSEPAGDETGLSGFRDYEIVSDVEGFEEAGAPAQVAAGLADTAGVGLPETAAAPAANVAHWATGAGWGAIYGATVAARRGAGPIDGPVLGSVAWVTAYSVLPLAHIYRPVWEYDAGTLARDLSAHLVFGTVAAGVHRLIYRTRQHSA